MVLIELGEPESIYYVAEDRVESRVPSRIPDEFQSQVPEPDRESTATSRPDRESTTASRVSHMSREEIIEELEAVETQLQETTQEKETWKSKCQQTETEFQVLQRETSEEMETLRFQTNEEIDSLKGEQTRVAGQLAGLKNKLTPQFFGLPAEEVESLLRAPEPTRAEEKVGRCLTNRKFIIFMLYANLVCGALYLYVFTMHMADDKEFIPRPTWLIVIDWIFCGSFVLATLLRLFFFRLSLRGFWNVFEFALLPLFIIEQVLSVNSSSITDEQVILRNTFQAVRVLFVFKIVPVLTNECKAARKDKNSLP